MLVRLVCALALLSVGFAHRMPMPQADTPYEMAAFGLPDGTLPVLCLPGSTGDTHKDKTVADKSCEACRISASVLLHTPAETTPPNLPVVVVAMRPWTPEAFRRLLFPPNAQPRAPPASAVTA
nr:hypothetical protein [uncultured Gellertiella sp.]